LDWQPFRTSAEAEERAKELALRGEGYAIEEHGEACSQCGSMMHFSFTRLRRISALSELGRRTDRAKFPADALRTR
jgi:hypothetical protein